MYPSTIIYLNLVGIIVSSTRSAQNCLSCPSSAEGNVAFNLFYILSFHFLSNMLHKQKSFFLKDLLLLVIEIFVVQVPHQCTEPVLGL